jgi:hypothetical protein
MSLRETSLFPAIKDSFTMVVVEKGTGRGTGHSAPVPVAMARY